MPVVLRSLLKVLKRVHSRRCLACQVDEERRPVKYGDKIRRFWERRIRDDGDTKGVLVGRRCLECNTCDGLYMFAIGKANADVLSVWGAPEHAECANVTQRRRERVWWGFPRSFRAPKSADV